MSDTRLEERRSKAAVSLLMRILATGAVWSIVAVAAARLPHPVIRFTLAGAALAVTALIWTHQNPKQ